MEAGGVVRERWVGRGGVGEERVGKGEGRVGVVEE